MVEKHEYAEVLMEFATSREIDRTFTYKIPSKLQSVLAVGMRVFVPFGRGNNIKEGYVIALTNSTQLAYKKIKSVHSIIDDFIAFSPNMMKIAKYMAERYGCTLAAALDVMLPPNSKGKAIVLYRNKVKYVKLFVSEQETREYMHSIKDKKNLKNQYNVLQFLLEFKYAPIKHITELLQIGSSAIHTLCRKNIICEYIELEEYKYPKEVIEKKEPLKLGAEQQQAIQNLYKVLESNKHETFLLHGITGSGKTEIFLQLIDRVIQKGHQAIVLVPEISLTPQTVRRFKERFGNHIGITHSRLSPRERMNQWILAKQGKISVMIGPRSAVFTPFEKLSLIIIDEEHESTYKSETTPKFHAKEVAMERMKENKGILLLASATPDLETYYNTTIGKYSLLELTKRVYNRPLPVVDVVDMRAEIGAGNRYVFSNKLHSRIKETLAKKEQIMLFLNRRGHSTFVSCRNCGYVIECKHCNITMTYHSNKSKLICHYCGNSKPEPKSCPACNSPYIRYFGDGTQKLEQEAKMLFPNANIARMDIDTTTRKNSHEEILTKFRKGKIDILIGTQMIAKGHDFPNVTLVGIVAVDTLLYMQDFRATERTFQLLTQVTGRAGRGEKPGEVIIQTYNPNHHCIQIATKQDYLLFYKEEIALRKLMGYPPFTHLFTVLILGDNEEETIRWAHRLMEYYRFYNKKDDFDLLGPMPAAISKIADVYRWRIVIKSAQRTRLKNYGLYCIAKLKEIDKPSTIQIQSDIDPNMLY